MLLNQKDESIEKQITQDSLLAEVQELMDKGFRFIVIDVFETEDAFDLRYQFGKEYDVVSLRMSVAKDAKIPSISPMFFSALLIENENQDLFGLKYTDLVLDYGGRLYIAVDDVPAAPQSMGGIDVSLVKKWQKTDSGEEG
jgi:Ni,Fe-hydrogenase III component G